MSGLLPILLIVTFQYHNHAVATTCPSGWVSESDYPSICYFTKTPSGGGTYTNAEKFCENKGGTLPYFKTLAEYQSYRKYALANFPTSCEYQWLGVNATGKWLDGTSFGFSFFDPNKTTSCQSNYSTLLQLSLGYGWTPSCDSKDKYSYVCQHRMTTGYPQVAAYTVTSCGDGSWFQDDFGNCYLYVSSMSTWSDAQAYCASKGATLATFCFTNGDYANFVLTQSYVSTPYCINDTWLGVNSSSTQCQYDTSSKFQNATPGFTTCTSSKNYFCQIRANYVCDTTSAMTTTSGSTSSTSGSTTTSSTTTVTSNSTSSASSSMTTSTSEMTSAILTTLLDNTSTASPISISTIKTNANISSMGTSESTVILTPSVSSVPDSSTTLVSTSPHVETIALSTHEVTTSTVLGTTMITTVPQFLSTVTTSSLVQLSSGTTEAESSESTYVIASSAISESNVATSDLMTSTVLPTSLPTSLIYFSSIASVVATSGTTSGIAEVTSTASSSASSSGSTLVIVDTSASTVLPTTSLTPITAYLTSVGSITVQGTTSSTVEVTSVASSSSSTSAILFSSGSTFETIDTSTSTVRPTSSTPLMTSYLTSDGSSITVSGTTSSTVDVTSTDSFSASSVKTTFLTIDTSTSTVLPSSSTPSVTAYLTSVGSSISTSSTVEVTSSDSFISSSLVTSKLPMAESSTSTVLSSLATSQQTVSSANSAFSTVDISTSTNVISSSLASTSGISTSGTFTTLGFASSSPELTTSVTSSSLISTTQVSISSVPEILQTSKVTTSIADETTSTEIEISGTTDDGMTTDISQSGTNSGNTGQPETSTIGSSSSRMVFQSSTTKISTSVTTESPFESSSLPITQGDTTGRSAYESSMQVSSSSENLMTTVADITTEISPSAEDTSSASLAFTTTLNGTGSTSGSGPGSQHTTTGSTSFIVLRTSVSSIDQTSTGLSDPSEIESTANSSIRSTLSSSSDTTLFVNSPQNNSSSFQTSDSSTTIQATGSSFLITSTATTEKTSPAFVPSESTSGQQFTAGTTLTLSTSENPSVDSTTSQIFATTVNNEFPSTTVSALDSTSTTITMATDNNVATMNTMSFKLTTTSSLEYVEATTNSQEQELTEDEQTEPDTEPAEYLDQPDTTSEPDYYIIEGQPGLTTESFGTVTQSSGKISDVSSLTTTEQTGSTIGTTIFDPQEDFEQDDNIVIVTVPTSTLPLVKTMTEAVPNIPLEAGSVNSTIPVKFTSITIAQVPNNEVIIQDTSVISEPDYYIIEGQPGLTTETISTQQTTFKNNFSSTGFLILKEQAASTSTYVKDSSAASVSSKPVAQPQYNILKSNDSTTDESFYEHVQAPFVIDPSISVSSNPPVYSSTSFGSNFDLTTIRSKSTKTVFGPTLLTVIVKSLYGNVTQATQSASNMNYNRPEKQPQGPQKNDHQANYNALNNLTSSSQLSSFSSQNSLLKSTTFASGSLSEREITRTPYIITGTSTSSRNNKFYINTSKSSGSTMAGSQFLMTSLRPQLNGTTNIAHDVSTDSHIKSTMLPHSSGNYTSPSKLLRNRGTVSFSPLNISHSNTSGFSSSSRPTKQLLNQIALNVTWDFQNSTTTETSNLETKLSNAIQGATFGPNFSGINNSSITVSQDPVLNIESAVTTKVLDPQLESRAPQSMPSFGQEIVPTRPMALLQGQNNTSDTTARNFDNKSTENSLLVYSASSTPPTTETKITVPDTLFNQSNYSTEKEAVLNQISKGTTFVDSIYQPNVPDQVTVTELPQNLNSAEKYNTPSVNSVQAQPIAPSKPDQIIVDPRSDNHKKDNDDDKFLADIALEPAQEDMKTSQNSAMDHKDPDKNMNNISMSSPGMSDSLLKINTSSTSPLLNIIPGSFQNSTAETFNLETKLSNAIQGATSGSNFPGINNNIITVSQDPALNIHSTTFNVESKVSNAIQSVTFGPNFPGINNNGITVTKAPVLNIHSTTVNVETNDSHLLDMTTHQELSLLTSASSKNLLRDAVEAKTDVSHSSEFSQLNPVNNESHSPQSEKQNKADENVGSASAKVTVTLYAMEQINNNNTNNLLKQSGQVSNTTTTRLRNSEMEKTEISTNGINYSMPGSSQTIKSRNPEDNLYGTTLRNGNLRNNVEASSHRFGDLYASTDVTSMWHTIGSNIDSNTEFDNETFTNLSTNKKLDTFSVNKEALEDAMALTSSIQDSLAFILGGLNDSVMDEIGEQRDDLLFDCLFDRRSCRNDRDIIAVRNNMYGNCFTFNFNTSIIKYSLSAGMENGLKLIMHIDQYEYNCNVEQAGIRMIIHDQEVQGTPESDGYYIQTGLVTYFHIEQFHQNMLKPKCFDLDDTIFDYTYSVSNCQTMCYQNYMVQYCNCTDPRYMNLPASHGYKRCGLDHKPCLDFYLSCNNTLDKTACDCRPKCGDISYRPTITKTQMKDNADANRECRLNPQSPECTKDVNYAMVYVYYGSLNSILYTELRGYDLSDMLSDFSGIVGLYTGAAVFTVFEILPFIYLSLKFFVKKVSKKFRFAKVGTT